MAAAAEVTLTIDDFKSLSYKDLDAKKAKILIGAMSYAYDDALTAKGLDGPSLRGLMANFESKRVEPLEQSVFNALTKVRPVSFNYFHVESFDMPDDWTDYGDEDWTYTGFHIGNPFSIQAVVFRYSTSGCDPACTPDIELHEETPITRLQCIQRYGIGVFQQIANVVGYEMIIRNF